MSHGFLVLLLFGLLLKESHTAEALLTPVCYLFITCLLLVTGYSCSGYWFMIFEGLLRSLLLMESHTPVKHTGGAFGAETDGNGCPCPCYFSTAPAGCDFTVI